jgi:bifunctional polynucleotide phosphatase/kinase
MDFKINKENNFVYFFPKKNIIQKVAFFDLDYTLIKPKSGRKFPKDKDDYIYMYENVIESLNEYILDKYMICIISNQNGLLKEDKKEKFEDIIYKLNHIFKDIQDKNSLCIFLACGENYYRKPHTGAFHFYESFYETKINKKSSFFCGDALGRKDDFSASDYYFALNCGLKCYSPETMFENNSSKKVEYNMNIKRNFLEEAISNKRKKSFENLVNEINNIQGQKLIIMNGSMASGKSTFASYMNDNYNYIAFQSDILGIKLKRNVENFLKININVIVDATNITKVHRKIYIDLAKKINKDIQIICVYIPYNEELIHHLQHYRIEKSRGLMSVLPEIALRVYKSKYEKPVMSEGFDYLFEYNPYFTFSNKSDEADFMKYY